MNKISKGLITTICLVFMGISICQSQTPQKPDKDIVLTISRGPNNPRNSEGDFITLKNGRILYIYTRFTGDSYMDHASAFLASRYSDNGGKTWSIEDKQVVAQEGTQNVMSVSLFRLPTGEIAMIYLKKNSLTDCMPMIRFSSDEAKTWSEPVSCITDRQGYFVIHNNRVIQMQNGRLILPVAYSGGIYTYFSDDNGRTWKSGSAVPKPEDIIHQEPAVVELSNGDLSMIMRTGVNTQYITYSKDRGESWSPSTESNIISASQSPASIAKIPGTSDMLLVWNNNTSAPPTKAQRTPLNIAVSKNDGKSWENMKAIENNPKGSFCYTAIHFTGKHVLLAYFDWADRDITIKRIKRDWIYK